MEDKLISVKQYAEKIGVSERTVRNYCASGKIEGAFLVGKTWNVPADAVVMSNIIILVSDVILTKLLLM